MRLQAAYLLIIILLLFVLIYIIYKYKSQSNQIRGITRELSDYLKGKQHSKLLYLSDDKEIQKLLIDINKLLEHQFTLEIEKARQEKSSKKMLSNISHDLKTPLTVIFGYSEMLLDSSLHLQEPVVRKLEKIYSRTCDVMKMIDVFFNLAKIESGDLTLNYQEVNVSEVLRSEILSYYDMLIEEGFQVNIKIPEEEIKLTLDIEALKRILSNLIQNAIKYGVDGKYLEAGLFKEGDAILIQVTDKGKGIVEDHQDKIFERLVTLEDSRNKKYQGNGLGLTITKRLTEAMGGSIKVTSIPYEHTSFTVTFLQALNKK